MKKVLLTGICMLTTVFYSGTVQAQEATPQVTFTPDAANKTLTISGQGDLTNYTTTDFSARVFTDKAVGYVFTDAQGTKVNAGDSYSASKTYYQAEYEYTKVHEGEPSGWTYFNNAETKSTWNTEKISNLYQGYYNAWGDKNSITIESKVTDKSQIKTTETWNSQNENYNYTNMSVYFVCSGEAKTGTYTFDELESKDIKMLTLDEFKSEYISSQTTYQVSSNYNMFKSTDDGQTYMGLTAGTTYTWTPGEAFYTGTATYAQIEDNSAFFSEKGSHADYIKADETPYTFNDLLLKKIQNSNYETISFENKGTEPLLINATTVQNILYPNNIQNGNIKELNLGEATVNNLTGAVFEMPNSNYSYSSTLEKLTLPLTNKTKAYSETTKEYEEKMIVPASIIPMGYNDKKATLKEVTIPEGYERIGDKAFSGNVQITKFNLPSTLTLIGKEAFSDCTGLQNTIVLNEGLENIGERAFANTNLNNIKFPQTLKIIDDGAFYGCPIFGIKFNAGLKYIGNSAFALTGNAKEKAEKTIEIPASVRYIGPFAFQFRYYQDIFFYGKEAPIMPLGTGKYNPDWGEGTTFYVSTYMGDSGFDPGKNLKEGDIKDNAYTLGYANRENYKNNNVYFSLLHFPKNLDTDEQRATYTDITRIYKTVGEGQTFCYGKTNDNPNTYVEIGKEEKTLQYGTLTAAKDCDFGYQDTYLGKQYIWPSKEQWERSYIVNYNGYNWNGVDKYRTNLTEGDLAILEYAGYKIGTGEGEYSRDELEKIAHMGTRLFVLANADVTEDKDEDHNPEYPINIKGGAWWTICVPFNMTKAQVDKVFGKGTHVCRFNNVERLKERDGSARYIRLYFQNDVYTNKSTKDENGNYTTEKGVTPADDDIVIYAHESYMIYPKKSSEDANEMYNIKDYQLVTGSPLPTIVNSNENDIIVGDGQTPMEKDDEEEEPNKQYRFIGNYQTSVASTQSATGQNTDAATQELKLVTIPQYSYIFAQKKGDSKPQFWFYVGKDKAWEANKCVVQATAKDGGAKDYETYFLPNEASAKKVYQQSFFGEDNETTGVERVEIIAGAGKDAQIIYNLNGQVVNYNGNMDGLQKGIYIKNGKKYMVK